MRTLFRSLLSLAFIVWLGAEIFFPVVAATVFRTLAPDTHNAGRIVGSLLTVLHHVGMVCGLIAIAVLALAPLWGLSRTRGILAAIGLFVVMIVCTAYSQYGIRPSMERDRIAAGGAIQNVPETHPARVHFNLLHHRSERIEQVVLFLGLAALLLVLHAETTRLQ
jgi:uncharacterized membrane protein (DUF485 family)